MTAVQGTAGTYLSVFPTGYAGGPGTSNLNVAAYQTLANLVVSKVAADGSVTIYNYGGSIDVVADVEGYYSVDPAASTYRPLNPVRLLDTRLGTGAPKARLGPNGYLQLQIAGGALPATGIAAVTLNVTAVAASAASYLSVFPTGYTGGPGTSNLNVTADQTLPNLVVSKIGSDGSVTIYNYSGTVDVVVDVEGWSGR
ncbi:MAG: hypothetical protein NVSMB13_10850 [Mycobacteriales bacterium]